MLVNMLSAAFVAFCVVVYPSLRISCMLHQDQTTVVTAYKMISVLKELKQGLCTSCQIAGNEQKHENNVGQCRHQKDKPIYDPKGGNVHPITMAYASLLKVKCKGILA